MSQDALNAAWKAPKDTEEGEKTRHPSSLREIELPTGEDEELELDTGGETGRHLASVKDEDIELPPDESGELELDTDEKRFAYGIDKLDKPVRIRPDGPKRKAA